MNKKISFPLAIIIIVVCAVLIGLIIWQYRIIPGFEIKPVKYSECEGHYTVTCYQDSEIIKENIPCISDEDCTEANMEKFCSPGNANVLDCIGAKYYCGNDGFCKGCNCPI